MAACMKAEKVVIEVQETYTKQTYRNHYEIAGPNLRQKLTIPVIKTNGNHTQTKDIRIGDDIPWQKIHLRSITSAYNKSPYLLYYLDEFLPFFEKKYHFLLDLNQEILSTLFNILHLNNEILITPEYRHEPAGMDDQRNILVAKKQILPVPFPEYTQPFTERYGFLQNLSSLDLIFCLGPGASDYLKNL